MIYFFIQPFESGVVDPGELWPWYRIQGRSSPSPPRHRGVVFQPASSIESPVMMRYLAPRCLHASKYFPALSWSSLTHVNSEGRASMVDTSNVSIGPHQGCRRSETPQRRPSIPRMLRPPSTHACPETGHSQPATRPYDVIVNILAKRPHLHPPRLSRNRTQPARPWRRLASSLTLRLSGCSRRTSWRKATRWRSLDWRASAPPSSLRS